MRWRSFFYHSSSRFWPSRSLKLYSEIPIIGFDTMSPKKIPKLPRQTIWIDDRGRIVVPEYLRESCGLEVPGWVVIERYPEEGECKSLFLRKG